jgi:hypothetical protein
MTKLNVNFWDQDLEYKYFSSEAQPDYRRFLDMDWPDLIRQNNFTQAFDFSWSLRSVLWPELIRNNALEIRFSHDGVTGDGYGPLIYFGNTSEIKDLPTESLRTLESDLTLENVFFTESDMFLADHTDDQGFLGIQSLQIEFLSYEDTDQDDEDDALFEHTFTADFRITDVRSHQTTWKQLSELEQKRILDSLVIFSLAQLDEFEEYVHEVTDLLAAILVHPDTHLEVTQTLLTQLEKLKLNELRALIRS